MVVTTILTERGFVRETAAWVALTVALFLALPRPLSLGRYALGCVVGLGLCLLGFHAADRTRGVLPRRVLSERLRLGGWSLAIGTGLGGVLLGVLWLLARNEPSVRARFMGRLAEPAWRPWALALESSIVEEILFRLTLLSCIAWLITGFSPPGSRRPFAIALVLSTLLFGLAHLPARRETRSRPRARSAGTAGRRSAGSCASQ